MFEMVATIPCFNLKDGVSEVLFASGYCFKFHY